jgi:hypothetical protein
MRLPTQDPHVSHGREDRTDRDHVIPPERMQVIPWRPILVVYHGIHDTTVPVPDANNR